MTAAHSVLARQSAKADSSPSHLLRRKCDCGAHTPGGETCSTCGSKQGGLQRKLAIGRTDDPLEAEADHMADLAMSGQSLHGAVRSAPAIRRRASDGEHEAGDAPASIHETLSQPGLPLEPRLRRDMEDRFDHDFSHVRIHSDMASAQSAHDVQASAYTAGRHVVFGAGQFDPVSAGGRHLIAHELAHVVQQDGRSDVLARAPAGKKQHAGAATAGKTAKKPQTAPKSPFVIEYGPPNAGQMLKGDFLAALKQGLLDGCNAELKPFGYTAKDCPFILRTIEHYARLPASAMIGVVSKFGKVASSANAGAAIAGVVANARVVARRLAQKRYPKLQSLSQDQGRPTSDKNPVAVERQLGGGTALAGPVRSRMESAFGTDFSQVRFHDGGEATRLSTELGARAFTVGQHVAFNHGEYRPGTQTGDWMIAHELAHTIQQDGRNSGRAAFDYGALESEADRAADRALASDRQAGADLHASDPAVQRLPVVVAGAIELGEVTLVAAEVTAVSAEVTVTAEAVVVATEVAPVAIEAASIPVATAATEVAVAETAVTTTAAASSSSTLATTAIATGAALTLSGDGSTQQEEEKRRDCMQDNPYAVPCEYEIPLEEIAVDWLMSKGYEFDALGNCWGRGSVASIDACSGAPGVSFHCDVAASFDPISKRSLPARELSAFGCQCCNIQGKLGVEWRGLHWSPGDMSK